LYDTAFSKDKNLTQVLAHELAHQYFRQLSDEDIKSYRKAADWFNLGKVDAKPIYATSRTQFALEDSNSSIDEDFANNIELYLYDQTRLKKLTPKIADWIQNQFGVKFNLGKGAIRGKNH
jgi:hypothetical protein